MPSEKWGAKGGGTQTAAYICAGREAPGNAYAPSTFEYDGTNFSTGGVVNSAVTLNGTGGTLTAGFKAGGSFPGAPSPTSGTGTTAHEQYDGTSWTNATSLSVGVRAHGHSGTQDNFFLAGGRSQGNATNTLTQKFDGTSFATTGSLANGANEWGANGTATSGLVYGASSNNTEEYTGPTTTVNVDKFGTS